MSLNAKVILTLTAYWALVLWGVVLLGESVKLPPALGFVVLAAGYGGHKLLVDLLNSEDK